MAVKRGENGEGTMMAANSAGTAERRGQGSILREAEAQGDTERLDYERWMIGEVLEGES